MTMHTGEPGPSLKAIEAFIAVVEEESVTGGARRLGASVSSVSMQLSNLEKALGSKLLERSAQHFALTEAGLIFRNRAVRIVDELNAAKADLASRQNSPHFILRMAIVEDFDSFILPGWLGELSTQLPNARFSVKSGPSHENFSILGSRAADIIVAVDAMDPVEWIEEYPLMRDPYLLVTSGEGKNNPSPDWLMKRPFFRYAQEQHMGRQIEAQLRRVKFIPPKQHEMSSNQALFACVARSDGWCITTAAAIHGTISTGLSCFDQLKFHPLPFPAFSRNVSLYARKDILAELPEIAASSLRKCISGVYETGKRDLNLPLMPEVLDNAGVSIA